MADFTEDEMKLFKSLAVSENNDISNEPFTDAAQKTLANGQRMAGSNDFSPEEMKAFHEAGKENNTKPSNLTDNFAKNVQPWLEYMAENYQEGDNDVAAGHLGYEAMNGRMTLADAEARISKLQSYKDKVKKYNENADLFTQALGGAVQTTPFMLDLFKGGMTGGVVGAGGGALEGAARGAVMGGVAGTIALGPEAALSGARIGAQEVALADAQAGFNIGFKAGMFNTSAQIQGGNLYLKMRRSGIEHDQASKWSAIGGASMAALEWTQVQQLGAAGLNALKAQLEKEAVKQNLTQRISGFITKTLPGLAKTTALEIAEEINQQQIELATRFAVAALSNKSEAMPTMKEWADEIWDTFTQSALTFPVLTLGAHAGGHAAGVAIKPIKDKLSDAAQVRAITKEISKSIQGGPTKLQRKRIEKMVKATVKQEKKNTEEARKEDAAKRREITNNFKVDEENAKSKITELHKEKKDLAAQKKALKGQPVPQSLSDAILKTDTELKVAQEVARKANLEVQKAELQELVYAPSATPESNALVKEKVSELDKKITEQVNDIRLTKTEGNLKRVNAKLYDAVYAQEDKGIQEMFRNGTLTAENARAILGKNGRQIAGLIEKSEELEREQGNLQTVKELLQEDLLTDEDIRNLSDKIRDGESRRVLNTVVQQINKAAKQARWDTMREIKQNRARIKALLRYSGLSKEDQAKFTPILDGISSDKSLTDRLPGIMAKIDQLLAKADMDDAQTQLASAVKKIKEKPVRPKESNVGFETQEVLNQYHEFITDEQKGDKSENLAAKTLAEANDLQEADAKNQDAGIVPPMSTSVKQYIAAQVVGLNQKSADEIRDLADTINTIIATGKESRLARIDAEKNMLDDVRQQARALAEGERPLYTTDENGERHKLKVSKVGKVVRAYGEPFSTYDNILDRMFIDSKNENAKDLLDVHDEVQQEEYNIQKQSEKAHDALTNEGDEKLQKLLNRTINNHNKDELIGEHVFFDKDTGGIGYEQLEMPIGKAVQLLLTMRNPNRQLGLAWGNGYTFKDNNKNAVPLEPGMMSTEEALEKRLTLGGEIHFVEALQKIRAGEMYERLNAGHVDEFGYRLPKQENYDGHRRRIGQEMEDGSHLALHSSFQDRRAMLPGALSDAAESKRGYVLEDAFESLQREIKTNEHWLAFRKKAKVLRAVASDPVLREIIEHKHGENLWKIFQNAYQFIIGTRGIQHVQQDNLMRQYRTNAATAFTGGKPLNAASQLSGIMNYAADLTPGEMISGVADFFKDPEHAMDVLGDTVFMQNRARNLDLSLSDALRGRSFKLGSVEQKFVDSMMSFIMYFDRKTIITGGWAVYKTEYDRVLKETGDKETAHNAAVGRFERVSNRLQGSSTPDQITNFERGGDLQKAITLFYRQPLQAHARRQVALMRAINHKDLPALARVVQVVIATHLAQAAYEAIAQSWGFWTGDDQDKKTAAAKVFWAGINGPQLPLIGSVLYGIESKLTNNVLHTSLPTFEPRILPTAIAGAVLDLGTHALKIAKTDNPATPKIEKGDYTEGDIWSMANDLTRLTPFVTGIPFAAGVTYARGLRKLTKPDKGGKVDR